MNETDRNHRGGVNLYSYLLRYSRSTLLAAACGLAASTFAATVNLANVTADTTLNNGTTLTGTLNSNVKLTIASGATITLSGVTINGVDNSSYKWAGLTCAGNATIILAEGTANTIKGFDYGYPGVYVPEDKTLTIKGNGSLTASSNGMGAGIGGGKALSCGNIVIEGGNINATGGGYSAAIGSGFGFLDDSRQYLSVSCGDITISGGNICATGGDNGGAGIGCGMRPLNQCGVTCGNITIYGGNVIAAGGGQYGAGIGSGYIGTCCGIAIFGGVINATGGSGYGAGIGCGAAGTCGGIAIMGGTIRATGNGEEAAGIGGGGRNSSCGMISIEADVTSVTASEGTPIGAGNNGSCVAVKIGDVLDDTTSGSTRTIMSKVVNLANVTENTTIGNGKIITGTLAANVKVSIADGATVTLRDATINGVNDDSYDWAGLTCEGDATIILEGNNTVKGFYDEYPGIYVPESKTLTIMGDGSLDASSNGYASGIGGGYADVCGNIVIKGGNITAMGGNFAAGIGGGKDNACGEIYIVGGTVNATGGQHAAGIGGGTTTSCGNITITKGVTSVTATKGDLAPRSVGASSGGSCGIVTIGGVVGAISESPYTYYGQRINLAAQSGDYTASDGEVLYGETTHTVTVPGGASVTINGVEVAGGGGAAAGVPSFAADAETATTKFVKGTDGKWRIVAFAELATGTAAGVEDMVSILRGNTPDAVETPVTPDSLFATNAVKVEAVVTPPAGAQQQFFKVKFGE